MIVYDKAGMPSEAANQVIRMRDVIRKVNLSESHLYLLIAQGKFPKPFSLVPGGRAKGWLSSTIDVYLSKRSAEAEGRK
jgi:prophage regulatory protein